MLFALSTESDDCARRHGAGSSSSSRSSRRSSSRAETRIFPGKKWRNVYVVLCIGLFLAMMSTVIVFGKEDEEAHAEEAAAAHPGRDDSSTETTPAETTPTETKRGRAAVRERRRRRRQGRLHEQGLRRRATRWRQQMRPAPSARTSTRTKPDEALIVDRVVNGKGAMPPFKEPAHRPADRRPRRVRPRVDARRARPVARPGFERRSLRYHPEAPEKWPSG